MRFGRDAARPGLDLPRGGLEHARHETEGRALPGSVSSDDAEELPLVDLHGEILERLSLLAVHTREHFLHEEAAMREARFPAYPVHQAEHDRVLAEMDAEARAFREHGDGARLARYLRDALPAWFVNHVRTMDVVTARFLAAASRPREAAVP